MQAKVQGDLGSLSGSYRRSPTTHSKGNVFDHIPHDVEAFQYHMRNDKMVKIWMDRKTKNELSKENYKTMQK